MKITVTWHNAGPHTIWAKLAQRLGREPTDEEAKQEVLRILRGEPPEIKAPRHGPELAAHALK